MTLLHIYPKLTPVFSSSGKKGDTAGGQRGLARQPHGGGGYGAQGGGAVGLLDQAWYRVC